jgi:hypothetical protein
MQNFRRRIMKKLLIFCAVLMMFAVSAVAQAATVNVSLEPSTKTVLVGDTFDLQLWFRSSPTGVVVHHLDDLGLHWDPACVSFDGPASTADGAYAYSTAMCYMPGVMCKPMYWDVVAANATYTDGDAELQLDPLWYWVHSMSRPTTDQHQLTLTFTALALTDSTSIWLTTSGTTTGGVWAENPDAAHVMDCTGDLTGATVSIVPSYACSGFEPPFDDIITLKKKNKRAIPVKMFLVDDQNNPITDEDVSAPPVVNVVYGTSAGPGPEHDSELVPPGLSDDGNEFRFDPIEGLWIINLATKQFTAPGEYTVTVVAGDSSYVIDPSCIGTFIRLD